VFTVCPKCTLTLVVTTVDLRAGQGYVRCGRCSNVFNALIALREGDPNTGAGDIASRRLKETEAPPNTPIEPAMGSGVAIDPEPEPEPEQTPEPEPEPELPPEAEPEPEQHHDSEPHVEAELAEEPPAEPSLEFDPIATDVSQIFIPVNPEEGQVGSGTYESIVMQEDTVVHTTVTIEPANEELPAEQFTGDDAQHTETIAMEDWSLLEEPANEGEVYTETPPEDAAVAEGDPEPVLESPSLDSGHTSEPAANDAQATTPDAPWVEEMFAEAEAKAEEERVRTAEREALAEEAKLAPQTEPSAAALAPLLKEPKLRRPKWQYISAISVLAVLLGVQVIHHFAQALVLNPTFGPALSSVYGWFGATVTPRWDLMAYSVTQRGAETEGGEGTQLRVMISLQNDSDRVQPMPLLRLTLQDRYGNPVASRDLEPKEYLPAAAADRRLLEPNSRIDAVLHVLDPGRAAIGFEIDACLKNSSGGIGCANDARRRAAG
jgi:predicted Zn finger-like uncharacterized protein